MVERNRVNSPSDREIIETELDTLPSFRGVPGGTGGTFGDGGGGVGGGDPGTEPGDGQDPSDPEEYYGPAPTNFEVKQQNLRFDQEGNQIWDVVISWDAVPGAEDYEIRFAKREEDL